MSSRTTTILRPRPRCLIAGKNPLLSDCLSHLLKPAVEIRAVQGDVSAAAIAARDFRPDIAIFLERPRSDDAMEIEKQLTRDYPGLIIIHLFEDLVLPGGLHVSGRSRPDTGLVTGLHATTDMALTVMRRLADGLSIALQRKAAPPPAGLRRRDGQILALLARGLEMKQVARLLDISPRTVAFYKYRAMEENDLKTREGLVNFALLHCCPNSSPGRSGSVLRR